MTHTGTTAKRHTTEAVRENDRTTQEPELSISIVHHDGLKTLRDCLESLAAHPPRRPYEIVIVDNVSTDGAREMLAAEFPDVRVLCNESRKGFGENQNTGLQASRGRTILLLNDDTLVHPGALDALCDFMEARPKTGVAGARLLNADGSLQLSCYRFPSPLRCVWENLLLTAAFPNSPVFGDYRAWPHNAVREVDFVIGAALLVRREAVEQAGYFDLLFFMYSEETDWQKRIHQAGWTIDFCPDSVITHLGGQSSEGMKDRQFCEFNRSQIKFIRKHYGAGGAAVQRIAMIFGSLLRLGMWTLLFPVKKETARENIRTWKRLLRWWAGFGPHEGIAELMQGGSPPLAPQRQSAAQ